LDTDARGLVPGLLDEVDESPFFGDVHVFDNAGNLLYTVSGPKGHAGNLTRLSATQLPMLCDIIGCERGETKRRLLLTIIGRRLGQRDERHGCPVGRRGRNILVESVGEAGVEVRLKRYRAAPDIPGPVFHLRVH